MRHADLRKHQDTTLKVSAHVTAGRNAPALSAAGRAVRIFTGAPMPAGADAVFMQEEAHIEGNNVVVPNGLKLGANCLLGDEDVHIGAVVRPAGRVLDAQYIALAAAQIPSRILGFAPPMTLLRLAIDVTQSGR
jgi:molybdopterin molybdotransferase